MTIGTAFEYVSRGKSPNYVENSFIRVINQACIYWDGITYSKVKYQDETKVKPDAVLQNGDILITSTGTGTLGRCAVFLDPNDGYKYMADSHVTILRNSKKYLPRFLAYFFMSDTVQNDLYLTCVNGSTNQIELSKDKLKRFSLPCISMDDQKMIVSQLSWIDSLVSLRKQQLAKLDELVKARFVEMFGNPLKNDKGMPTVSGEALFKLSNGKTLPNSKRFSEGIPAYGGNGISWYTDEILCDYDTIIVGRVGFQSGNVHLAKAPLWVTDNAMYISSINSRDCDIRFLCALMEHIDFTRYQDAGDLKKITQKPFMQMQYLMPPMLLQKKYIAFVEQVDKSKLAIQQSLDKLETLKKSLMQKYFG